MTDDLIDIPTDSPLHAVLVRHCGQVILDATERAREDTCIAPGPADWAERAGDGAEPEWTEDQEELA